MWDLVAFGVRGNDWEEGQEHLAPSLLLFGARVVPGPGGGAGAAGARLVAQGHAVRLPVLPGDVLVELRVLPGLDAAREAARLAGAVPPWGPMPGGMAAAWAGEALNPRAEPMGELALELLPAAGAGAGAGAGAVKGN